MAEAAQHGWGSPVRGEKAESDRCFERLTRALVDAFPLVRPAIASHNIRSLAHAIVYAQIFEGTNQIQRLVIARHLARA
jgi:proline dehydrogenase